MYFLSNEHNPSHIHAYYGEYNAIVSITNGKLLEGNFPSKELKLVRKWVDIHKGELQSMWETQCFKKIMPLDEEK